MKVVFITIVLDGLPFVSLHYPEFRKLPFEWEWRVAEGVAAPMGCTSWCRLMPPRLSLDGTKEYLDALAEFDPRVILFRKALWRGKVEMLNTALKSVNEPCLLVEVDADELWTAEQIAKLRQMFIDNPQRNSARFFCNYHVGPKVRITSRGGFGNMPYEWNRAWRITPGTQFSKHEPPVISGMVEVPFTQAETEKEGLVFDHFAYATEAQVEFKSSYYGSPSNQAGAKYANAVENWRRLQENRKWPVNDLQAFLPWVGPGVTADRT